MKAILFALAMLTTVSLFPQSPCETAGPIPFQEHSKWGYLSEKGVVIPPRFDIAGQFSSEGAIACANGQCGVIDKTGLSIGQTWERKSRPFPERYSEGLAPAVSDEKWGYIDHSRTVVIPFQFLYAGPFNHGTAKVRLGEKYFFIDKTGTRVTPEFDGVFDFHEDLAAVEVGKNVGYIRRDGSLAIPAQNGSASGIDFSEGLAAVRLKGKVGFMDKTGTVVIEPKYDDVYAFSNGLAPVELGGKWGYVDHQGKLVAPIKFDIGHMFSEGLASVYIGRKWGYIDTTGNYAIPAIFDAAMPFCGGIASVETSQIIGEDKFCRTPMYKGKHGMIDHHGNYVWREAEEQTWRSPVCH